MMKGYLVIKSYQVIEQYLSRFIQCDNSYLDITEHSVYLMIKVKEAEIAKEAQTFVCCNAFN